MIPWYSRITQCSHQAKLAARGASVLAASGDYGTAGAPPVEDKCMDKFFPTWPAASPWVSESVPAEYPTSILSTLVSTPQGAARAAFREHSSVECARGGLRLRK